MRRGDAYAGGVSNGVFRRTLRRLSTDTRELDAEELQGDVSECGATPVGSCPAREQVCVAGTLQSVKLCPRGGVPTLTAELYDGSGTVLLIWLGRRRIAGIEPGQTLIARGRLADLEGSGVIYNPRYELRPTGAGT